MLRPQKQSDTGQAQRGGRQRLEPLSQTPTLDDLKTMLAAAESARGSLIEVSIRRPQTPVFVLTCQYDSTAREPVWSLYEGEDGSKVIWSYPKPVQDLELLCEVICFSLPGGVKSPGAIPPQLAPQAAPASAPAPGTAPAAPPAGYGAPQPPYGAPYPQQPYPQQAPYPNNAAPPPGYPQGAPQPYPPQPYPQQYPPQYPNQAPQQQPYQQPGYAAPTPGYGAPMPPSGYPGQPYPNTPYQQASGAPAAPVPPELKPTDLHGFIDLLSKSDSNILLGNLFIESGILPEPCVEAALKLQELVRKGFLSNNAAIEALRRAAERGGLLDDDVIAACRSMYPENSSVTPGGTFPSMKASGNLDPREVARQVILLIQQAGIVSDNDVSTAEGVRRKHGGDVGTILVAAGKIERATLEAGKRCFPLLREHRLNHEEAYRIIRHCQKTKASIEDACQALSIRIL